MNNDPPKQPRVGVDIMPPQPAKSGLSADGIIRSAPGGRSSRAMANASAQSQGVAVAPVMAEPAAAAADTPPPPNPDPTAPPEPDTSASEPVAPTARGPKHEGLKSVLSTILILLMAPLLAWCIVNYVFQSYEVDGPSMESTLQNHDRLIIWKVPHTWSRITKKEFVPNRGDVVVFVKKGLYDFDTDKEKQLVKRIIGLPGERVVVKDGTLTVYNKEHPEGFQPDKTLPYGKVITYTQGNVDVTVPAGEVFVCGDNRGNSLDSRYFGTVPDKDIVGKLVARILPISQAEKF